MYHILFIHTLYYILLSISDSAIPPFSVARLQRKYKHRCYEQSLLFRKKIATFAIPKQLFRHMGLYIDKNMKFYDRKAGLYPHRKLVEPQG